MSKMKRRDDKGRDKVDSKLMDQIRGVNGKSEKERYKVRLCKGKEGEYKGKYKGEYKVEYKGRYEGEYKGDYQD